VIGVTVPVPLVAPGVVSDAVAAGAAAPVPVVVDSPPVGVSDLRVQAVIMREESKAATVIRVVLKCGFIFASLLAADPFL
jgi:hypothetical protein